MQASLAVASSLLGLSAFYFDRQLAAALGGVLMLANWPYTLIVMAATNKTLGATSRMTPDPGRVFYSNGGGGFTLFAP